jgi:hypothetical protein
VLCIASNHGLLSKVRIDQHVSIDSNQPDCTDFRLATAHYPSHRQTHRKLRRIPDIDRPNPPMSDRDNRPSDSLLLNQFGQVFALWGGKLLGVIDL